MDSPSSLARWRGKIAFVTGGSSGIGRAVALDLAALGCKVAVSGRRHDALNTTVNAIRDAGAEALALPGDQTDPAVITDWFRTLREIWGGVSVLVNSAGTCGPASVLQGEWDSIKTAFDLNVLAALQCMREACTDMRDQPDAAIINLSSMTGHRVLPGTPALYAATKHALRILTDGVRAELAAENAAVKVALLSPGLVDTPWHARPGGMLETKGGYPFEPLQADDIAAAVRYILSAPPHVQIGDIQIRSVGQPF